jgi:hypothetical protein
VVGLRSEGLRVERAQARGSGGAVPPSIRASARVTLAATFRADALARVSKRLDGTDVLGAGHRGQPGGRVAS